MSHRPVLNGAALAATAALTLSACIVARDGAASGHRTSRRRHPRRRQRRHHHRRCGLGRAAALAHRPSPKARS